MILWKSEAYSGLNRKSATSSSKHFEQKGIKRVPAKIANAAFPDGMN